MSGMEHTQIPGLPAAVGSLTPGRWGQCLHIQLKILPLPPDTTQLLDAMGN